jgi:hypothetical protein
MVMAKGQSIQPPQVLSIQGHYSQAIIANLLITLSEDMFGGRVLDLFELLLEDGIAPGPEYAVPLALLNGGHGF